MDKKDDFLITGSTAIGALVGAAAAGTSGAIIGGILGYLIGKSKDEKIEWKRTW